MDLIDRQQAIDALMKIKAQKESCNCSRQRLREAQALAYAIAVLKKVPKYDERLVQESEVGSGKE